MRLLSARWRHYCSYRGQCGERREERRYEVAEECRRKEKRVPPPSGCQIPAGMLACQLSCLRRPAEMIMGLCGLAVLPLTDYCNAIIGVQMGPYLNAQPREHRSSQVVYSHGRLLPSQDGTKGIQHVLWYWLPIQSLTGHWASYRSRILSLMLFFFYSSQVRC